MAPWEESLCLLCSCPLSTGILWWHLLWALPSPGSKDLTTFLIQQFLQHSDYLHGSPLDPLAWQVLSEMIKPLSLLLMPWQMQLRIQLAILAALVPTLTDSALCPPGLQVSFRRATPSHADARLYSALWSWSWHSRCKTQSTSSPTLVFQQTCWDDLLKLNSMGFSTDRWVTSCRRGYNQSKRHWPPLSEHDLIQLSLFCQDALSGHRKPGVPEPAEGRLGDYI